MRLMARVALVIFALDQAVKYLVVHALNLRELGAIDVFPPYLTFRMAWNYGINFGLFSGHSDATRYLLIAVALAIVAFVLYWMWRDPPGKVGFFCAGLLIGGAFGNVVDRVLYGAVADFLNMSCCGINNPYAFNVADIAVFLGALGLVAFAGSGAARNDGTL
ncbi:MAG: signal peptidase II [Marinovum sp.]|nr:signal peptidase II [Marinovum sp.]